MSARIEKAVDTVNERSLDGVIIYSDGVCSLLRPSYFHYMAELRPIGPNNALIISKAGDTVLLTEPAWDVRRVKRLSLIDDVRGSDTFVDDLVLLMRELGLKGTVGIAAGDTMTEKLYRAVSGQANVQVADDIVEAIAARKSEQEIEHIWRVARIADVGFEAFLECSRVGIREYELSAEMEYAMRKAGADDNFTLLSSGKHNYAMHLPTDRRLEPGDVVLGEITPVCEGQFIQLCRTVVLGDPGAVLVEKYALLVEALRESLKTIRSGASASGISRRMNSVIGAAGYAKYCQPPYMRARGHGVGVGSMQPGGTIDDDSVEILARQQTIIVHPNQYLPETGYLACGETVMVADDGFVRLAATETELYLKEV